MSKHKSPWRNSNKNSKRFDKLERISQANNHAITESAQDITSSAGVKESQAGASGIRESKKL